MVSKFKAGDKVIFQFRPITDKDNSLDVGKTYEVEEVDFPWIRIVGYPFSWYKEDNFRFEEFTKADLKTGMRVEYRNGKEAIYIETENAFVDLGGFVGAENYRVDLVYSTHSNSAQWDIVTVWAKPHVSKFMNVNFKGSCLYSRKEKSQAQIELEIAEDRLTELQYQVNYLKGLIK